MEKKLINKHITKPRFSEVDSMAVVWHGNYIKYIEDGREAFGDQFGLAYYDVYNYGYMTPIVKVDMDYKNMVHYGDELLVETEFIPTDAAKIIFKYKIYNQTTNKLVLTAMSIQVFINKEYELMVTCPEFFIEWKNKWFGSK
jgi:acyl-CoA thioester hydrolase